MQANIIKGDEIEREIFSNLGELALGVLQEFSNNIIQIDADTGEQLTAAKILQQAKQLALFLIDEAVKHGDTISIMSENRLEFCIVTVSAFFVGATLAPLNPEYTVGELDHVMGFSNPKIIFASPTAIPSITGCLKKHDYVQSVIIFGEYKGGNVFQNFEDLLTGKTIRSHQSSFNVPHYNPQETVATILCSSGTSGKPKGVKTTHSNITACIEILCKVINRMEIDKNEDETDSIVGVAPFYHSFGFLTMFLHMLRGKTMIILKKFRLKLFLDSIVKYKVRSLMVPPPLLLLLLKDEVVKNYDLSFVKEIYIGAAALGRETELELNKRFKIRHAGQSYGMTETTWAVISSPHGKSKEGSVGRVFPGMMAKVVDENGKALGANQEGELCLKGLMIMQGYAGDTAATKSCIDEDGWLHTGDVAFYDDDKYFFVVDRLKELIKYKGFQVSPSEIEDLLLSHPAILDAAVIGLPDEYAGELPTAFVVKRNGHFLSASDVQKFVADNISTQKWLRGGVIFLKEIPRNSNGKILRRLLREEIRTFKLPHKL